MHNPSSTWEPVRNAKLWIEDTTGAILGQGATDDTGKYRVSWMTTTGDLQNNIRVVFLTAHKDGRFTIRTPSGSTPSAVTGYFTPLHWGGVKELGGVGVGNSAAPHWHFNAYWAAERVWREAFGRIGVLSAYMTNVDIRGFDSNAFYLFVLHAVGPCPTSCAQPEIQFISLDNNAALMPQHRIMHEMGHVASYVSHNYKLYTSYCYPNTGTGCGWSLSTSEWGLAAFEEAYATLGANVTLWDPNAVNPTTCLTAGTCFTGATPNADTDIELTRYPYAVNNCGADEGRWPLSAMRYMWDVYDSRNDADGDTIQEGIDCFWCLWANVYTYPEGTDFPQINEHWNANLTSIDNHDGRGSTSYASNYQTHYSKSTGLLRVDNCSPP